MKTLKRTGSRIYSSNYFLQDIAQGFPKDVLPQQAVCFVCPQQLILLLAELSSPRELGTHTAYKLEEKTGR